jgi:hypothetical protein
MSRRAAPSRVGRSHLRRGIIYTFVALLLLLIIGALFLTQTRRTSREEALSSTARVQTIDRFLTSFEQDSTRAAYIAGFRGFIAMEQHIASQGMFFSDPAASFREVFLNGSINGNAFVVMEAATFEDYIERTALLASRQGITIDAMITNVTLWQEEPWHVLVNYTLSYNATDSRGTARWRVNTTLTGSIPITDLRDPLMTVRTFGRVQRVVKPTNVSVFVDDVGDANDTAGLLQHMNSSWYVAVGRGPSMLMRFSGNTSDSPYGIESFVDTEELDAQGLSVDQTLSVIDYQYFTNITADACDLEGEPPVPQRIRLDDASLDIYGLRTTLNWTSC